MKEKLSLLTVLAVLSISLPAQGQPWLGSGTEGDPYLIEDANDMQAIGADPNYWDAHFIMVNDINLTEYTGTQFNIIGTFIPPALFTGTFDGNGHKISNFTYQSPEADYIGIFGAVGGPDPARVGGVRGTDPGIPGRLQDLAGPSGGAGLDPVPRGAVFRPGVSGGEPLAGVVGV